jgi:hypothetical protein
MGVTLEAVRVRGDDAIRATVGRVWRRDLLIALLLATGAALVAPVQSHASTIAYTCGDDICSVRPDGSGKKRLTTDGGRRDSRGVEQPYHRLSLSADGRRMMFNRAGHAYLADGNARNRRKLEIAAGGEGISMHPDGNGIWYGHLSRFCRGTLSPRRVTCRKIPPSFRRTFPAWGPKRSFTTVDSREQKDICVTDFSASTPRCTRYVARIDGEGLFYGHALSPNGRLLATAAALPWQFLSRGIALYDASTARFVRPLTSYEADVDGPIWSPDGRWVAYTRYIPPTNETNEEAWSLCACGRRAAARS